MLIFLFSLKEYDNPGVISNNDMKAIANKLQPDKKSGKNIVKQGVLQSEQKYMDEKTFFP